MELASRHGAHNYNPLPVVLSQGSGAKVRDVDGKEYLDFLACYSAVNFGHGHPRLVEALRQQAETLSVSSRAFHSDQLCLFVEELAKFCGMDRVLPMNSGTEAVETAIKLARKWGAEKKGVPDGEQKIVVMENNFHGRSITIVSFSTEPTYRDGFGPFTDGFEIVSFGDASAIDHLVDEKTVGVLLEPIQAEAGILIPEEGFLSEVREICWRKRALLILDEIQTGMGRTGREFCYEHEGAKPDLLILGKSLGGGLLPVSAVVGTDEVLGVLRPGEHGSTFGGNPLGCAVARTALKVLREERLAERAAKLGAHAREKLTRLKSSLIKEVRGKGLLIGVELKPEAGGARKFCERIAQKGVLCKETHDHVIRIAPPLIIGEEDLDRGLDTIASVLST